MEEEVIILRQLPDRFTIPKDGIARRVPTYEIVCSRCGEPKEISRYNLKKRTGLRHVNCYIAAKTDISNIPEEQMKFAIAFSWLSRNKSRVKRRRTLEVKLTIEEIKELIFKNCFYCGSEPTQTHYKYPILFNGIDRIDCNKTYTLENSRAACKIYNIAKSTMSSDEFYEWLDKIARFNGYIKEEKDESTNKNS